MRGRDIAADLQLEIPARRQGWPDETPALRSNSSFWFLARLVFVAGIVLAAWAPRIANAALICFGADPKTGACPKSLYLTANTGGPNSLSGPGHPTNITASLTLGNSISGQSIPNTVQIPLPAGSNNVTTLQQAAATLGYQGFEWIQQITNLPLPSPLAECASSPPCNAPGSQTIALSTPPAFNDPPPNGYNSFTTPLNPYPFYYDLSDADSLNPNLCINITSSGCGLFLSNSTGTVLNFADSPADPCIGGVNGAPSPGYYQLVKEGFPLSCSPENMTMATGSLDFTTALVGVSKNYVPGTDCLALDTCVDLDEFFWTDNFNGVGQEGVIDPLSGAGGVGGIASIYSAVSVDPNSGTGGITIVSENGNPIPEPPTTLLFATSLCFLWLRNKCRLVLWFC